jgi:acyl-[acyl carrier protein]--UDP-N-acetylglucosamine O-acyltransferase
LVGALLGGSSRLKNPITPFSSLTGVKRIADTTMLAIRRTGLERREIKL